MGIGLTIVETIVAAHGGTITARNNPDGGATFTVTLPPQRNSASGRRMTSGAECRAATARAARRRLPWDGEGGLPVAGIGLRCRGQRRRRRRAAGSRCAAPTRRDCARRQPSEGPRTGGVPSSHAGEPEVEGRRLHGHDRRGHQAAIPRCRRIRVCVKDRRRGLAVGRQAGKSSTRAERRSTSGYAPAGGSRYSVIANTR